MSRSFVSRRPVTGAFVFMLVLCALALGFFGGCSDDRPTAPAPDDVVRPIGPAYSGTSTCDNNTPAPSTGTIHIGIGRVVFLDADFQCDSIVCVDDAFVEGVMATNPGNNVRDLLREASYGLLDFTYDVFPVIRLDMNWMGCGGIEYTCPAIDSLIGRGIDPDDYDMFVWAMPRPTSCNGVGGRYISGTRSAISYSAGTPSVYVHEMGHGFGIDHAWRGGDQYGDGSDFMGKYDMGLRGLNAPHKEEMGWIGDDDIWTVDEIPNHTQIGIAPLTLEPNAEPVAVKIAAVDGYGYYWLSYRIDEGADARLANPDPLDGLYYIDGLTVHYQGSLTTTFLDILGNDDSYTSPDNEFSVTQNSVSDSELLFTINLAHRHHLALSPTTMYSVPFTINPHQHFDLTITNETASTISITVTPETNDPNFILNVSNPVSVPGNSYTTATVSPIFPNPPSEGAHDFTLTTTDTSDPLGFTTEINGTLFIDGTAPTTPQVSWTSTCEDVDVHLSWYACSDGSGSGIKQYNIYRDGDLRGSTTSTSWVDDAWYGQNYSYRVEAEDLAGNTASSSFQVQTPHDNQPPSKPAGLSAYAPHQWVDLSWNPCSDDCSGVESYLIERDGYVVGTSSTTSFSDSGTQANTLYTYRVAAVDYLGHQSLWSKGYKVTTGDELIIGQP